MIILKTISNQKKTTVKLAKALDFEDIVNEVKQMKKIKKAKSDSEQWKDIIYTNNLYTDSYLGITRGFFND